MRRALLCLALLGLTASATPAFATTQRDCAHDFDFLTGDWNVTYHRLRRPLAHAHDWYSFPATSQATPIWNGLGQVQDNDLHSPLGAFYGITVRMYNAQTRQWALYWGTNEIGMQGPPEVGGFDGKGHGLFYGDDTFGGKKVRVRFTWNTTGARPHFEQAFSDDGGKTWEVNWISDFTKVASAPQELIPSDFDFLNGAWTERYSRLRHPLAHAHDWYSFPGSSNVRSLWQGRGQVEAGSVDDPHGKILGVTVRIVDPKTHTWRLYWGTSSLGMNPDPQVGKFDANGVGIFDAPDMWHGKKVIVRYKWVRSDPSHPHFEQSFSVDQGKTWEANWTTDYSRAGE